MTEVTVKERPITLSAQEVRAKLAGARQFRRLVKFGKLTPLHKFDCHGTPRYSWCDEIGVGQAFDEVDFIKLCPFGKVGDRIWGREKFSPFGKCGLKSSVSDATYVVLEDGAQVFRDGGRFKCLAKYNDGAFDRCKPWRPSTQMPRWASRFLDEIVAVRVERCQDISEADAIAEGMTWGDELLVCTQGCGHRDREGDHLKKWEEDGDWGDICPRCSDKLWHHPIDEQGRQAFREHWDSIHGAGSWESNPWVWVIDTKPVSQ